MKQEDKHEDKMLKLIDKFANEKPPEIKIDSTLSRCMNEYQVRIGKKIWIPKSIGILLFIYVCFVGCSTHKHCGTAHYSTMTNQDYENIRQRGVTTYYMLHPNECRNEGRMP